MKPMFGWRVIPGIEIGSFRISPHGIGIAIGYFIGAWVMARRARARNFSEEHTWNAALWGMVGAILGARVAYLVGHYGDFESFVDMLQIWEGGISLVGGLLGGITAGWLYTKRHGISFMQLMDLAAPGLGIGIAVGRIGDLMIGDHLGKETSGLWGWTYQGGELISPPPCVTDAGAPVYSSPSGCLEPGMTIHQTALYDMVWSLVIFGILLFLDRKPRPRGFLFFSWGFLYALGRIVTDFLRVDKTWFGLGLTGSQITSITFALFAIVLILRLRQPEVAAVGGTHAAGIHGPEDAPRPDEPYEPVTVGDKPSTEEEKTGPLEKG